MALGMPTRVFASRRGDPATKREAILATAAQLFLEKSYGRTSLNDVAERLSITKPALYHYFRNKEQILLECYRLGTGHDRGDLDRDRRPLRNRPGKGRGVHLLLRQCHDRELRTLRHAAG